MDYFFIAVGKINENLEKITLDCLTENFVGSVKLENAWSLWIFFARQMH